MKKIHNCSPCISGVIAPLLHQNVPLGTLKELPTKTAAFKKLTQIMDEQMKAGVVSTTELPAKASAQIMDEQKGGAVSTKVVNYAALVEE
jgi:hypothetical protein